MADILARICSEKRENLQIRTVEMPFDAVQERARAASPPRGFIAALEAKRASGEYGLIAEIKKASPSRGIIREDFDPETLARAYEAAGAACLSVLTDVIHFQGSDMHLKDARTATGLPVLRKDFMLEPYQIFEARMWGADCVLLILAALGDGQAQELEAVAMDLGMDVLLEAHNADELDRALALRSPLVGINNRNLKTLTVDLTTTETLAPRVPADRLLVCESGLNGREDLARMAAAGAGAFLIGESLMRRRDVEAATRALLEDPAPVRART